ncbi:hypothetical protein [Brucella intermedia]|uniref:hypothetical protein n=1 Tax=Brucella intermedia TaxID=94625 RepID=UPI00224B89BB|nr:hypothetical protein [Brucella intermedia]
MPSLAAPRKLDELDAVNLMLRNLSETPVSLLGPTARPTAQKAEQMLAEESIDVQSQGWNFNTDRELVLHPNTDGEILLPDNILSFMPINEFSYRNLQENGNRLYDGDKSSFKFDGPVTIEAILARPWGNLPQPARWYIAVSAALRLYASENPGGASTRLTAQDLEAAKVKIEHYDARLRKGGMRVHNPFMQRMRRNR